MLTGICTCVKAAAGTFFNILLRNNARAAAVTVDVSQAPHAAHISTLLPSGALCVVFRFFLREPNELSFSHWCFSCNKQHTNKATKRHQMFARPSASLPCGLVFCSQLFAVLHGGML